MGTAECHGICERLVTWPIRGRQSNTSKYPKCRICEIKIDTTELRCPCCNTILSTRVRGSAIRQSVDSKPRIS